MAARDLRIDAYIVRSAEFAMPILEHLRSMVRAACREVEETRKWSMPHVDDRGEMMCSMAAFKGHAVFAFRKGALAPWRACAPGHRRECVQGVQDAKQGATRTRRITTTVGQVVLATSQNWRYDSDGP